jgi:hypothetical protein
MIPQMDAMRLHGMLDAIFSRILTGRLPRKTKYNKNNVFIFIDA